MTAPATAPPTSAQGVKIAAAYGRLYVSGPGMPRAASLAGAAHNPKRNAYELSLTLETLRALRQSLGVDKATFSRYCTPDVLAWAKAAGAAEQRVNVMHEQLAAGFRANLPWLDTRAGTVAPQGEDPRYLEANGAHYRYRLPYDHQKIMATAATMLDGAGILGEVGTGKTRAALEAAGHLLRTGQIDVLVVVGKKATLDATWAPECREWATDLVPKVLLGNVAARRTFLQQEARVARDPAGPYQIMLLNHDVLKSLEPELVELCQRKRVGLILDEAQKVRNPEAQVTQAAMRIASVARWRLILTGSPVIQGEQDVWSQWYVLDLGTTFGPNFVQYRREWLVEDPYTFKTAVKSPEAQTEVGLRMRRRAIRVTKAEGLPGLPPQVYVKHEVEMGREQAKAYRELEDELVALLSGERHDDDDARVATASNQLAMILRLTQVTSGFVNDSEGAIHRFAPNPKLEAVKELVEENLPNGSIIVWAWYREDVRAISEAVARITPSVVQVVGGQPDRVRAEAIARFREGDARVLVGNQASGGVGLNLQRAPLAIYYSQGYNLEDRLQSEGRNHRGGSEVHSQVTYIDVVAKGTIDDVVRAALSRKKSVADAVVDLRRAIGAER